MTQPYSPHQRIGAGDRAPTGGDQRNTSLETPDVPEFSAGAAATAEQAVAAYEANREHGRTVVDVANMSNPGTHTAG